MTMNPAPISPSVIQMESDGTRINVSRPVSTGVGTAWQVSVRPNRDTTVPPKGGNTPNTLGDGGNPAPEVRGTGLQSSRATQDAAVSVTSNGKRLVLPGGSVVEVRIDRRGTTYRVVGKDAVIKLVAEVLFIISKSNKGSMARLSNKKMISLLGLSGHFDALTISWMSLLMSELGFKADYNKARKRTYIEIDMDVPIMKELKAVKSVDEAIAVVRKHLGE
jgi:hypothetical protein